MVSEHSSHILPSAAPITNSIFGRSSLALCVTTSTNNDIKPPKTSRAVIQSPANLVTHYPPNTARLLDIQTQGVRICITCQGRCCNGADHILDIPISIRDRGASIFTAFPIPLHYHRAHRRTGRLSWLRALYSFRYSSSSNGHCYGHRNFYCLSIKCKPARTQQQ